MRTRTRQARPMRELRSMHPEGQQGEDSEQRRTDDHGGLVAMATECMRAAAVWVQCSRIYVLQLLLCTALSLLCSPPPAVGSRRSAACRSVPPLRLDSLCCTLVSLLLHWCRLLLSIDAARSTHSLPVRRCSAPLPARPAAIGPLPLLDWFGSIRTRPSSALLFATWLRPLPSAI